MRLFPAILLAFAMLLPETARAGEPILLDFCATWCGPCQSMTPIVAQLKSEGYDVRSVDIDHYKEAAQYYRVTSIPQFVLIDGATRKEINRLEPGTAAASTLRAMFPRRVTTVAPRTKTASAKASPVVRIVCTDARHIYMGSGVVVGTDGNTDAVLTANHVTAEGQQIAVKLSDGSSCPARIIAADPRSDIAMLSIRAANVGILPVASETPAMGQPLWIAGYGGEESVYRQVGGRRIDDGNNDLTLLGCEPREGDSGGPIMDQSGQVVGILSAKDADGPVTNERGQTIDWHKNTHNKTFGSDCAAIRQLTNDVGFLNLHIGDGNPNSTGRGIFGLRRGSCAPPAGAVQQPGPQVYGNLPPGPMVYGNLQPPPQAAPIDYAPPQLVPQAAPNPICQCQQNPPQIVYRDAPQAPAAIYNPPQSFTIVLQQQPATVDTHAIATDVVNQLTAVLPGPAPINPPVNPPVNPPNVVPPLPAPAVQSPPLTIQQYQQRMAQINALSAP